PRTRNAGLQRGLVDRATDAVESDESELDASHVDDGDRAEAGGQHAVFVQELVSGGDASGSVVREVVVGKVHDLGGHQGQTVDEARVATESEALGRAHRAA